ncbi:putative Adenylate kinase, chloroplastic [Blattamonas nauphoetae]|uniref:Adenylate kinase, chloroplastic n=1 Tax=Blattamonas nauphoetae TaxID=2049346 RepID=A0ABQ9XH09_9EUKA|nr:putative Adenylate kinase, chloroplastic [Blattamonas nauphoetae]
MKSSSYPEEYLHKHNLLKTLSSLIENLVIQRPEEPAQWMSDYLRDTTRKVIITGAPASGKGTQCESIVKNYGLVHISTGDLLRAAVKAETDLGKEAHGYMTTGQLVPDQLVINLVKEKLETDEVKKKGWLLDGFPRTKGQAMAMKALGINPTHVILLNVADEILMSRALGRRLDPETGKIYHIETNPPPSSIADRCIQRDDDQEEKVRNRLNQYHANLLPLCEAYEDLMVSVDGSLPPEIVFQKVDEILSQLSPVDDTPSLFARVAFLGPSNSGARTQAKLLEEKFDLVFVDAEDFAQNQREEGEEEEETEDNDFISRVLERLCADDCKTRGYALINFPRDTFQITRLQNCLPARPTHTLFLQVDQSDLLIRQSRRVGGTKPSEMKKQVEADALLVEDLVHVYREIFDPVGGSPIIFISGMGHPSRVFDNVVRALSQPSQDSAQHDVQLWE